MKKRQRLLYLASITITCLSFSNLNAEVISIANNKTVTISGYSSVDLVFTGVNGTAVFDSNTFLNSIAFVRTNPLATIVINEGDTVNSNSINFSKTNFSVTNYGVFVCDTLTSICEFVNDGQLIASDINIHDKGTFTNNLFVECSGSISCTASASVINNGVAVVGGNVRNYNEFVNSSGATLSTAGYISNYSSSTFINDGYMSTANSLTNYGEFTSNDTIIVSNLITINGGSFLNSGYVKTFSSLNNHAETTNSGTLYVEGDLNINENSTLLNEGNINCGNEVNNDGTISNGGELVCISTFDNNSSGILGNSGSIESTLFRNSSEHTLTNAGEITTNGSFENYSDIIITLSGVILTTDSYVNKAGSSLNNSGVLRSVNNIKNYGVLNNENLLSTQSGYFSNYSTGVIVNNGDFEIAGNISNYYNITNSSTGHMIGFEEFINYDNTSFVNNGMLTLTSSFYNYGEVDNSGNISSGNFLNKNDALLRCGVAEASSSLLVCKDLYLQDSSFLSIDESCEVDIQSDLFIESTPISYPRQLISGSLSIAKSVQIEHTYLGDAQWQFQTVPMFVSDLSIYGETFDEDYAIYYYDQDERSEHGNTSTCWRPATELKPGQGYIFIFAESTTVTYTMSGEEYINSFTQEIDLELSDSPANESEAGWNLVGNPYFIELDWDRNIENANNELFMEGAIGSAIYVYDMNTGYYNIYTDGVSINGQTGIISPLSAFFVKSFEEGAAINFNMDAYQSLSEARSNSISEVIRITFGNGTSSDEMILRFKANATEEFDSNFDAYKLTNNNSGCQVYSLTPQGTKLAVNTNPQSWSSHQNELFVGTPNDDNCWFKFEITENDQLDIYLIDKEKNECTLVGNNDSIPFFLSADTHHRFIIAYRMKEPVLFNECPVVNNASMYYSYGVLTFDELDDDLELRIFTLDGKALFSKKLKKGDSLLRKMLKKGLYVVNIGEFSQIVRSNGR